eukprot:772665-Pyramimonas_sp.AAC.1
MSSHVIGAFLRGRRFSRAGDKRGGARAGSRPSPPTSCSRISALRARRPLSAGVLPFGIW